MTYLAHESCDATGRLFSVGGGRVAEVFIAEAPGFYKEDLTAEDVADNWAAVTAQEGYTVPRNLGEETALYVQAFRLSPDPLRTGGDVASWRRVRAATTARRPRSGISPDAVSCSSCWRSSR